MPSNSCLSPFSWFGYRNLVKFKLKLEYIRWKFWTEFESIYGNLILPAAEHFVSKFDSASWSFGKILPVQVGQVIGTEIHFRICNWGQILWFHRHLCIWCLWNTPVQPIVLKNKKKTARLLRLKTTRGLTNRGLPNHEQGVIIHFFW